MATTAPVRFVDAVEGKSIDNLARLSGVSRSGLFRILKGQRRPTPLVRRSIASVLGVEPDSIVYPEDGGK